MFCFQCEQTADCKACAGNMGVYGKKADTAELQDKLGIKNIRLGPTLPAFVSPNVISFLGKKFSIVPVTTPEGDLRSILGV